MLGISSNQEVIMKEQNEHINYIENMIDLEVQLNVILRLYLSSYTSC